MVVPVVVVSTRKRLWGGTKAETNLDLGSRSVGVRTRSAPLSSGYRSAGLRPGTKLFLRIGSPGSTETARKSNLTWS